MKHVTTDKLLSLGMALHADKRTMEMRVRSIFARRYSAWFASLAAVVLCGAIGVLGFTTACQPAEETVSETGTESVEFLQPTEAPFVTEADNTANITGPYEAPAHLNDTLDSHRDDIEIVIDADVIVPTQTSFPIYSMQRRVFTQEDADRALELLVGDADFVTIDGMEPASKKLEFSTESPTILFRYNPRTITADGRVTGEWTEESIAEAKADGNSALMGRFRDEYGAWMQLMMINAVTGRDNGNIYMHSYMTFGIQDGEPIAVSKQPYSSEEAMADAVRLLELLEPEYEIDSMVPYRYTDEATGKYITADNMYSFRCHPGVSAAYEIQSWNSYSPNYFMTLFGGVMWEESRRAAGSVAQMQFLLDASGIRQIDRFVPVGAVQEASQPARLLPFTELQTRLNDLLSQSVSPNVGKDLEPYHVGFRLEISRLELGYKLLEELDGKVYYRPVWSVCGKLYHRFNEQFELDRKPGINQYLLDENDEHIIAGRGFVDDPQDTQTLFLLDAVDGTLINCIN